ncbi:MAG: helix-turn-helix transcriptional regulator [Clostridia bacterium]|nr:helix-turn-helix transcriptional regulator [Clostridia bacterium]
MEKSISSDLIRGHIDTIILYSLISSDKFAGQISEYIAEKSQNEYEINQATLYSSLKRLENLKYITAYRNDSASGRRQFFKITELGKNFVEKNLNNWQYSKEIIDKLVNITPVKTEISNNNTLNEVCPTIDEPIENNVKKEPEIIKKEEIVENNNVLEPKIEQNNVNNAENNEDASNFRAILKSLIKYTIKEEPVKKEKMETCNVVDRPTEEKVENNIEIDKEMLKFNEKIHASDVKNKNYGKIDYSDLTAQAEADGYKLRVSSKIKKIENGPLFINKLTLYSSLITFILLTLQLIVLTIVDFDGNVGLNKSELLIFTLISAIFPIITSIIYYKKPEKTGKKISADIILTYGIIVFNLILITFALNLVFEVNLFVTYNLYYYFLMPIVFYINTFIYSIIKYRLSKNKTFIKN